MQKLRRKNMHERVPQEYGRRNDFVMAVEMKETCNLISKEYGVDLSGDFYKYY